MKISKLSNFNNSFCSKTSSIQNNDKINKKLNNVNLIGIKMDEFSYLYAEQEINGVKIIKNLNELKNIFALNNIDMESLGFILFNFVEKNLISVLKLIESKLILKKSIEKFNKFFPYMLRYIKKL